MPANRTSPNLFDLTRERIRRDFDSRSTHTRDRLVFWQGYVSALAQARSLTSSEAASLHNLILLESEKNPELHPWYPARKRPADGRHVLVLFRDGERIFMQEAFLRRGVWRSVADNHPIQHTAQYWMSLPDPPDGIL
jgi:hypothetical protein